jgi:hypothetical protein
VPRRRDTYRRVRAGIDSVGGSVVSAGRGPRVKRWDDEVYKKEQGRLFLEEMERRAAERERRKKRGA